MSESIKPRKKCCQEPEAPPARAMEREQTNTPPTEHRPLQSETGHGQNEVSQQKSNAFLAGVLDDLVTMVAVLAPTGEVILANSTVLKRSGLRSEDVIGFPFHAAPWWNYSEEAQKRIQECVERCADGESLVEEIQAQMKDGLIWIEFSIHPVYDENGKVKYLVPEGRDITDRKRTEEALRESEERFRDIAESMSDWVWEVNADGVYTYCTGKIATILGFQPEEIIGKTPFDFMPPEEAKRVQRIFEGIAGERQPIRNLENWNHTKDNRPICLLTNGIPMFNENGEYVGYRGVDTDITERKRSEDRVRLLSSAIEQSSEGIAVVDLRGNLLFVNKAFAAMHGYTVEELSGKHLSVFHTAEHMPAVDEANRQIQKIGEFIGEIEHVRRDGTVFPGLMHNWLLRDETGEAIGMIGTVRDVTEQKQTEQAVREAQKALLRQQKREKKLVEEELAKAREELLRRARLATLGQLAGSIAHELRNPLGSIRNAAYFLKGDATGCNPKWIKHLEIIDNEVNTSNRIIGDLLEMSRGKEPRKRKIDLGKILLEALDRANLPHGVFRRTMFEPEPFEVYADREQLGQVLANILVNAGQAMEGHGEIVVTARHETECDEIVVRDTGPGVTDEDRGNIFEPLFSTKAKGTGLGLSICKQIIKQHGGSVELLDDTEPGAAFCIRLPRKH